LGERVLILLANHFNGFWTDSHKKELLTISTHSYTRLDTSNLVRVTL
jgi:hypothetical protein